MVVAAVMVVALVVEVVVVPVTQLAPSDNHQLALKTGHPMRRKTRSFNLLVGQIW